MNAPTPSTDLAPRRSDGVIAYTALAIAVASVLSFFAIMIASTQFTRESGAFEQGVWPIVSAVMMFGLPIAFVLIMYLVISSMVRRSRAAKAAKKK